ncbi:Rha family transcriptional regulator [Salmonella enterica]|nr:Rha family transcriptional regulator [Salmonella enterica]
MNTAIATTNTASLSLVVDNTKPLTMTTLQIAELTGKEHKDVRRDFRNMIASLEKGSQLVGGDERNFAQIGYFVETTYKDSQNRTQPMYELDEDLCNTLVMGYDAPLRHKIAKEWRLMKEGLISAPVENPFANMSKLDWMRKAVELEEEKQQLIDLHIRKSVDAHSMTRLLGEKRGSLLVQKALNALKEAGYIERVYDDVTNKPKGYIANDNSLTFCRMNAHFQLEFTVDVLPVLVGLGVLEEEQKETLRLPQPNNTLLIQNKAAQKIRESSNSLTLVGFGI